MVRKGSAFVPGLRSHELGAVPATKYVLSKRSTGRHVRNSRPLGKSTRGESPCRLCPLMSCALVYCTSRRRSYLKAYCPGSISPSRSLRRISSFSLCSASLLLGLSAMIASSLSSENSPSPCFWKTVKLCFSQNGRGGCSGRASPQGTGHLGSLSWDRRPACLLDSRDGCPTRSSEWGLRPR